MRTLPFIKMHGLGNDYIYVDCFSPRTAQIISKTDLTDLARRVSDRHRGIGSDGLVLILPSKVADAQMRIFNADGSEAKMCGNAARCIGKYLYESGRGGMRMTLETLSGIKQIAIQTEDEKVALVTVNMGKTIGNPHKVFFVERPNELDSFFEHLCIDSQYADMRANTNIECAYVLDRHTIRMRVHERGSGETMACGTGACATALEAMDKGFTAHEVHVLMPGGAISVCRDERGDIVMTGTATEICRGDYILEE